ncbi:MAG: ATP-binding cassette domain-containing protein [Armatimonadota bacterium]|nr:ATP-binding cassette domain-containing protein [Armatimonadota bacterium]MDR5703096.1 ATP-binding cassette domain-containing protein [Armatimonadota bacterium]MDR7434971.1 ATP-binding cassette domain-containing protein [Armatimonadota bacterium]
MNAIEAENLTRRFGDFTAVQDVSFTVAEGEIFAFLGPNGAGKTTTINMLCTLLRPTSGTARVGGYDVRRAPHAVRRNIGLVFQDPSLDDRLTAWQNLWFHAMLYDLPRGEFHRRARYLLDLVELMEHAHREVRTFSGGMKRRLEIARGLLHRPKVLFLDEPTLGLDPQTRRHIWEHIISLRDKEGSTIFFTTHYMDEAENADRIAIIDHGRIVALDTPENLKATIGGDVLLIRTSDDRIAAQRLKEMLHLEARLTGEGLLIEAKRADQLIPTVVNLFQNGQDSALTVYSVNLRRPSLDDVFIKLTGRALRDEEASPIDRMRLSSRLWRGSRR